MKSQKGNIHIIVIVLIILVILGTLGYVFWQRVTTASKKTATVSISTSQNTSGLQAAQPDKKTGSEITTTNKAGINKYTNYDLGFSFEFPAQTWNATTTRYKNGNCYAGDSSLVNNIVLNPSAGEFYVVQSQGLEFTSNYSVTHDTSASNYWQKCQLVTVTNSNLLKVINISGSLDDDIGADKVEVRAMKVTSQQEATTILQKWFDTDRTVSYGDSTSGRQDISLTCASNCYGGGKEDIYYYPGKLVVNIRLGQSVHLEYGAKSPDSSGEDGGALIANSFTTL